MSGFAPRRALAALGAGSLAFGAVVGLGSATQAAGTCVPTVQAPTLEVEPGPVRPGSTVTVTGAGWCHPSDGGSRVAIKLDEGGYSRLDDQLHENRTIWAIVEASPVDGTFSFAMEVPDGTTATSTPAFVEGSHTLRALSGSIKAGDEVRTVKSGEFVVGEYRPNGPAELLGDDDLVPGAEDDVLAVWKKGRLLLSVTDGVEGDWVFVSLLAADGSPRYPWGATWLRLDADGRVLLPAAEAGVSGDFRLVVQNGNSGQVSELLGWTGVTFVGTGTTSPSTPSAPTSTPAPRKDKSGTPKKPKATATPSVPATPVAPVPTGVTPAVSVPTSLVPAAAVLPATMPSVYRGWSSMLPEDELASSLDGDVLRVQLGYAAAGEEGVGDVFVHVVSAEAQQAAGWTVPVSGSEVVLDLRDLPDGDYRFSLQDATGKALGWAQASLVATSTATSNSTPDEDEPVAEQEQSLIGERDLWLSGVGVALLAGLGVGVGTGRATRRPVTAGEEKA